MTGAMYAAIAGLRTHMQNLNVIGNNIANVNTYGYKSARSVFKTALYTTLTGGSDGTNSLGGVNPSQIGYGASMGSIGIDMSTGNYAITGRSMDWMLDGDGFFITGGKTDYMNIDPAAGNIASVLNGMYLTRVGNFEFGSDGFLAKDDDGNCVYGFMVIGYVGSDGFDEDDYPGLEPGDPVYSDQLVPIRYPSIRTNATTGKVELVWPEIDEDTGFLTEPMDDGNPPKPLPKAKFSGITIDRNTGIITGTCDDTKELVTIGIVAVGNVVNPNGVTNLGNNYYQAGKGSGGLTVSLLGGSAADIFPIPDDATDTDGLAYFMYGSLYDNTDNLPDVCRLRSGGKTGILSNGLEMSKTDLAQEISQMILTQRGYQANTRVITVTDSMLEELVNMKR